MGIIPTDLALELGLLGPCLRGSGVDHDLRRDAPFFAYDEISVNVQTWQGGDEFARYMVRMRELTESCRLVLDIIDGIPEGPICSLKPVKSPIHVKVSERRQIYAAIETPRGELGTYVIGGGDNRGAAPFRCKLRPPSLHAMSALPDILPGHTVSDEVAILGSLDPIMGEVDR